MATLRLTPYVAGQQSTDIDRTNNRCTIVTGEEEVAQRIRTTLQQQLGECVYNKNGGTPYLQFRELDDQSQRAMIVATVRSVTGVRDVIECAAVSIEVNGARHVAITGVAVAESGTPIPFSTEAP